MSDQFSNLLSPRRLTEIVDIGANMIDGAPPYAGMLAAGLCRVTGFEPQENALGELLQQKGPNERYLPHALGDGREHTLNVCLASGMTSLYEPDPVVLKSFEVLRQLAMVTHRIPLQTRTLDSIPEITELDFLKIDIQGSELAVFEGGTAKLSEAVVVQTEVSFVTLYKDQPTLGEVDREMRRQGFLPHCFAEVKQWPIAPYVSPRHPREAINQLLEADIVYVRDFTRPELIPDEKLKHMALVAHHCYGSFDLALRCVMLLEQRHALAGGAQDRYLQLLPQK